jgi:hypothetical protein
MIPPEHYRKPFLFTAFTSTITAFSIFFWSLARAKGGGPFINESVEQITGVPAAKGTYLVWYVDTAARADGKGDLLWYIVTDGPNRCRCKPLFSSQRLRLMVDFEHVRLLPIRNQAERPNHFPSRHCPNFGYHDHSHRDHLYLNSSPVLPRQRTALGTICPSSGHTRRGWRWRKGCCLLCLYVNYRINFGADGQHSHS